MIFALIVEKLLFKSVGLIFYNEFNLSTDFYKWQLDDISFYDFYKFTFLNLDNERFDILLKLLSLLFDTILFIHFISILFIELFFYTIKYYYFNSFTCLYHLFL